MNYTLRPGLPPLPHRIRALPVSEKGFPVPYFVEWIDGKPDFRVVDSRKMKACVEHDRCWICGEPLGKYKAFVIGPMCSINRISGEPPSHLECADFAARACPFMLLPTAQRREANLPDDVRMQPGHDTANPGITLIWITHGYQTARAPGGGALFTIGDPTGVIWYSQGRKATSEEVQAAMKTAAAKLLEIAEQDGQHAVDQLKLLYQHALRYVPGRQAQEAQA